MTADHRAVTLTGTVDRLTTRLAAVRAAKRVKGVQTIADDIVVEPTGVHSRSDHDLAEHIEHALAWDSRAPDTLRATVREGNVTLDGTVDHPYQRAAAERSVAQITGVRAVTNCVTIEHVPTPDDVHERIVAALHRLADVDAATVRVSSTGGEVHLEGTVSSWAEHKRVTDAAWAAEGITTIVDDLSVC